MSKRALKRENPNRHKGIIAYRRFIEKNKNYIYNFTNVNGTTTRLNFHKKVLEGGFMEKTVYKNNEYQKEFMRFMNNMIKKQEAKKIKE